ncbi:MAG: hypothetical protein KGQ41_05300 [Alphaproteobacteria bacterium]|nr:hypothetical protein [Alphaproteobacteria bacterium]
MNAQTSLKLASETLPLEALGREEAVRLINAGRRFLNPIPLESGAFYFPQGGLYQLFAGPSGERVGIWAQNPDDLEFETLTVDEATSATLRQFVTGPDGAQTEVPVPAGTKLPMRIKDKGNGNIARLRVFSVKPRAMEKKWLREEINRHQHAFQSFTESYGTLFRARDNLWVSDGVIYQALPSEKTEGKFDLLMISAPAHGWSLGRNYESIFTGLCGKFLRAASVRAKGLSMEEIEKIVPEDFLKRAQKFVEGTDPYAIVLNGKSNGRIRLKYRFKKLATNFSYALAQLRGMRMLGRIGVVTAINGFIAAVAYVALGSPITPLWMLRIAGQTASGTGKEMFEYLRTRRRQMDDPEVDTVLQQYCDNFNHMQIWGGCLKPEMAKYLVPLSHDQLNTDLNPGEAVLKEIPREQAALEYIMGATEGPVGSYGAFFRVGNYLGIRIYEPGGLDVEYVPERNVAYATMDWAGYDHKHLPSYVCEFMEKTRADDVACIRVNYCRASRKMEYKALTKAEYEADVEAIRKSEYVSQFPMPDGIRLVPPPRTATNRGLFKTIVEDGMNSAIEGGRHVAEQVWKIIRGPSI